ncbi:family 16 glycosylhydrolase [Flammeovirga agarivorans]|uniref:Family 16 glycosylhydrolase n=1 Tax=Flammeovirga agarivorans TaxID=2726742 RepID=A0A7X8XUG3_9BACT|nr:family 16 glycosylhydrolase [Flammeovirga agarivorans]NLR90333.1 family 16 glycosylhydrolase [Flammeovirga agarivorans]
MKQLLFIFITFFSFQQAFSQDDCYELVWNDEFDYNGAPDSEKWGYDIGGNGWGNNEDQYYTDNLSNAQVTGGRLLITARKESFGGKSYTSARLISKNKGDWLYGKVVVRAKLPKGQGTWPAIWMLPTDWEYGGWPSSGEIDIMEHVGYEENVVHGTVHTEAYNHSSNTQKGQKVTISDATTAFHDYTLEWTEDNITVGYDDQTYFTFPKRGTYKEWPFDKRFHLLLNIAMGGNWGGAGGPTDDTALPATMEVEYVRVYQNTVGELSISGDNVVDKNSEQTYSVSGLDGTVTWTLPEGATITSDDVTASTITVEFGDNAVGGEIKAAVQGNCSTYDVSEDIIVVQGAPSEDEALFPSLDTDVSNWSIPEDFTEIFEVSADGDMTLVKFDVSDPSENPYIDYYFSEVYDFSGHNNFSIALKLSSSTLPDAMGIYLLDANLDEIGGDQLRLLPNDVEADCNVRTYTYQFENTLTRVRGIRMYINHGLFSGPNAGGLLIGDIKVSNQTLSDEQLSTDGDCGILDEIISSTNDTLSSFSIYPNPVKNGETLYFGELANAKLYSTMGVLQFQTEEEVGSITINHLEKGFYILVLEQEGYSVSKKILIE